MLLTRLVPRLILNYHFALYAGLLNEDSDEVLERNLLYMNDLPLNAGLRGVLMYVISRQNAIRSNRNFMTFSEECLERIKKRIAVLDIKLKEG